MRRFLSRLFDRFTDWLILDEPTRPGVRYFCATCAVGEGARHHDWCHRDGVMTADLPVEEISLTQVERELAAQARLPRDRRDADLVAFLLDMRTALGPAPADGELLPIRLRYHVPVVPGGAS